MILNYCKKLFTKEQGYQVGMRTPGGFLVLSEDNLYMFNQPISMEEIKRAVFEMGPFKAQGVDGLLANFYQHLWVVVGESVYKFAHDFFESGTLPLGVNDTLLVLLPMVPYPEAKT